MKGKIHLPKAEKPTEIPTPVITVFHRIDPNTGMITTEAFEIGGAE